MGWEETMSSATQVANTATAALGQFASSAMDADEQREVNATQMAFNAVEAQKSRDYQTQMSNSAYQRGTADMKAAGINPMLAFMKGGASSPSGEAASATLTAAKPGAGLRGMVPAISELQTQSQNLRLAKAMEAKTTTEALFNTQSTAREAAVTQGILNRLPGEKSESELKGSESEYAKGYVPYSFWAGLIGKAAGAANSALGAVMNARGVRSLPVSKKYEGGWPTDAANKRLDGDPSFWNKNMSPLP